MKINQCSYVQAMSQANPAFCIH